MALISIDLAGVRGRNRWGSPFIHISATHATPISVYSLPNIALLWLSHPSLEKLHLQRSSGPRCPHLIGVGAGSASGGALRANDFLFHQSQAT
jgi:hypothetical protein